MAVTIQNLDTVYKRLMTLYSSGGTYDTVVYGQRVYTSTGYTVRPITNIDAQFCIGMILGNTSDSENYAQGKCAVAIPPFIVEVDSDEVDAAAPPEVNSLVYLDDDGKFTDTDSDSSLYYYGLCLAIEDSKYIILFTGPVNVDS